MNTPGPNPIIRISQTFESASVDRTSDALPRGNTIPFPYPNPYPQQVHFMDTLLQSLHQLTSSVSSESSSSSSSCPVYMMESPTGTGKSLSLACAAMAWLRHVEQVDLGGCGTEQPSPTLTPERTTQQTTTSATATRDNYKDTIAAATIEPTTTATSTTGLDWVDDWVSPAQHDTDVQTQLVLRTAMESRRELIDELECIRQSLQTSSESKRIHTSAAAATASTSSDENRDNSNIARSTPTTEQKQERRQQRMRRRENLTRGAVTRERQAALEQGRCTKRNVVTPSSTLSSSSSSHETVSTAHVQLGDPSISGTDASHFDSTRSYNRRRRPTTRAQYLLNGAALDGSIKVVSSEIDRGNISSARTSTTHKSPTFGSIGNVSPGSGVRKVIYAARTHSQLSQFIGELRRTAWGSSVRVVHLGGRQALCGNPKVHQNGGITEKAVTEHCLDLQKGLSTQTAATTTTAPEADATTLVGTTHRKKRAAHTATAKLSGCPWLQARDVAIPTLALHLLAEPTDIEEAAALGKASQSCAYYASRTAIAAAEVVVLPYSMLLSPSTRESIGLALHQSFVIVDEAHNLPEALRNLHACRLTLPVITAALGQLTLYTTKYGDRLTGRNLFHLGQIRRILLSFQKHLQTSKPEKQVAGMMTASELLMARKLDNINLFEIMRYLERSRLSQKLLGFMAASDSNPDSIAPPNSSNESLSKHVSAMSTFETFLEKLTSTGSEGKVVTDWPKPMSDTDEAHSNQMTTPALRYVLIQPASFFENVLQQASALALVGGTLRPFVHVATELLGSDQKTMLELATEADRRAARAVSSGTTAFVTPKFTAFTCDHVVPSSNVLLQCVARGASGQILDFRYKERSTTAMCDELGRSLLQICQTVPCGVVIFLPSYSYEARLVERWKKTGLWRTLQEVKKIHREPKSSQHIEASLQMYARDSVQGAVLLSIVGGKMSEGINFSNDMARCVVVVGLPYPDITDPELKEKMATLDGSKSVTTGQAYYHNLCMRAVNQSVGRAIRHANDYATLILIDKRYTTDSRIWSGLSNWLKRGSTTHWHKDLPFDIRLQEMTSFFANMAKTNNSE